MTLAGEMTSWIDLSYGNFEVVIADFMFSEGEQSVVLRGDGKLDKLQEEALAESGFLRIAGPRTVWARPGGTFRPSEFSKAFPNLKRSKRRSSHTRIMVRGKTPFKLPKVETSGADQVETSPKSYPGDIRKDNQFQSIYYPASKLGKAIAMVPVNMARATSTALQRIEDEYGPIDKFVADRLGYSLDKLAEVLSPEQIDAVAMAIVATERDREMILADQTGLGKGRVLAATMLAAARQGKVVIFITEKANLFSDIYRDLMDIDAVEALGKPFLMNSGSRIIDVTSLNGDVLYEALPDPELRKTIKSKKLPEGCKFMMCTYSQYNRLGSAKESFLSVVAKDAYAAVDEAHNAAGVDSNTSASLDVGLAKASGVIRSSATFARNAEALLKYPRVLPPSLASEDVRIALQAGGNEIAEAVAQYLAEDGVLIRREHDLSEIKIEVVVDEIRKEVSREYSDALAPILGRLAQLQRMVDDEIETRNEDGQSEGGKAAQEKWYSANFGSRRAPLLRQFLTALSVEFCIDRCVDTLLAGEKPVVVIEQTMESMMRELSGLSGSDEDVSEEAVSEMEGTNPPDFKDALLLMVDRIMHMSVRRGKEDPEKIPVDDPYIVAEAENIKKLIEAFPTLSLSPIDDIRDRIEATSKMMFDDGLIDKLWKADEISARNLRVVDGVYQPMVKGDRNDTIVGFNSGGIDALVITRAASTGLSLHASERAKDQRRRKMIELQIPANVVERVQFWGRVNRRGQVNVPSFETLSTGLPTQMRTLAMNNRKVESLSATVSANSETATTMDVPDMINSIGNAVAQRILTEQPSIAEKMFIGIRNIDQEMADQELYYINKFLQGFPYLLSDESDELFEKLLNDYQDAVKDLEAQGRKPKGVRELDGTWKEVSRTRYENGSKRDGPVFGRPVDLVVMEGSFQKDPLTSKRISKYIADARLRLGQTANKPAGPYFDGYIKQINKNRRTILHSALSGRYISVDAALKDNDNNAVKAANERLKRLCEVLTQLSPGLGMTIIDDEGNQNTGVVLDVRLRNEELSHLPSEWTVRFACPGDTSVTDISVATIMREKKHKFHHVRPDETMEVILPLFDKAPRGNVTETRQFLDGNFVRAMLIATEISAGTMVSYLDDNGEKQRSVLIHKKGHKALSDRKAKIQTSEEAIQYMSNGQSVYTDYKNRMMGLLIRKEDIGYVVMRPKGKEWDRMIDKGACKYAGTFKADRKGVISARISDSSINGFLDEVFAAGLPLYFDNRTIAAKQNRFAGGPKAMPKPFGASPRF